MKNSRVKAFLLVWFCLAVGSAGLYVHTLIDEHPSVQAWTTWAPNTDPDGDGFIVHYPRGENPGFGGIKMDLGLNVEQDRFLCVKLETEEIDDDVYWDWQYHIWHSGTTSASFDFGTGAVCFGPFGLDTLVEQAHLVGQGQGTVRITPIWTVEDERIYMPNGGIQPPE